MTRRPEPIRALRAAFHFWYGFTPRDRQGLIHRYDAAGNQIHAEQREAKGVVRWTQDRELDVQHRLVRESHPDVPGASRTWAYDASSFMTGPPRECRDLGRP